MQKSELTEKIDALSFRLATETLTALEFENICRERNLLAIKRKMYEPRILVPQERNARTFNISVPKNANPSR
jgi:hypothetical protein